MKSSTPKNNIPLPQAKSSGYLAKYLTIALAIVILVLVSFFICFAQLPTEKTLPRAYVGNVPMGDLTREELLNKLKNDYNIFSKKGILVTLNNSQAILAPSPENQMVKFDPEATADRVFSLNQNLSLKDKAALRLNLLLFRPTIIEPVISVDEIRVKNFLVDNFQIERNPAENASWHLNEAGQLVIVPEKIGYQLDTDKFISELKQNLLQWNFPQNQTLTLTKERAQITSQILEQTRPQAEAILTRGEITLNYQTQTWTMDVKTIINALENKSPTELTLNRLQLAEWLAPITKTLYQPPIDAKFAVENGRVKEFTPSTDGQTLDIEAAINDLQLALLEPNNLPVELKLKAEPSKVTVESLNQIGVKELLGTGISNFKGSPKNRIQNITVGMRSVNGTIIKPGEEFSLVKVLGRIDATTGYLPELVIKENKTIPEYGGGLCQIGTTVFRGATATGLPITERQNHSYRVVYYEPAGTDATIYPPHPDLRFVNDTASSIIIIGKIDGTEIRFEFWGTKDGRIPESSKPNIYNITKPPATRIVFTENLKPGVKKCTESAHNGADADFTYKVTMPSGEVRERVFKSHYRPWQAVCLVGKAKEEIKPEIVTPTPTSTTPTLPPPPDIPWQDSDSTPTSGPSNNNTVF